MIHRRNDSDRQTMHCALKKLNKIKATYRYDTTIWRQTCSTFAQQIKTTHRGERPWPKLPTSRYFFVLLTNVFCDHCGFDRGKIKNVLGERKQKRSGHFVKLIYSALSLINISYDRCKHDQETTTENLKRFNLFYIYLFIRSE